MVTFNEAMLSNDRALAIRVGDFTSENIKSANFKYGYITGDDFTPGGTYAGTASILFTSIVESFKKLDVVYPEIGLLVGSKVEWVKMGKYYIDDIKIDRNANTTEIELMDEMFKLNESFKTDLKYPAQIRDVILEIATKTGVTLASDNFGMTAIQQHVSQPTGDKLTFRDVLGQVSQLLGFSCFFNRNGELEVRGLTESGITITADNYFLHGLEKSEVEYQIAGITCEVTNNEKLTVGLQTGRSLEIENPLATQDTLNLLYYALKDIVYYPYDLSYQGHLKLDVGQWVTIKTNKDETLKVPVLYQSFSFSGGLTSTISADSVAGSDAQYTYGSFVTKKIDQKSTQIQAEVQQQLKYADEEFKKVSNEMLQQSLEYQNSVRNELATSKAELETQIDTAKTQAESNAKAYADEINQATAEVAKQANTAANSLKSDLAKVKTDLTATTSTANAAKTSASEAKQQLTTVANDLSKAKADLQNAVSTVDTKATNLQSDLSKAKQDLTSQAQQLQAQGSAQSELTKRVSSVEKNANGTKTTVSELSKTIDSNTKNISSVTARTKTVEDDLTSTKTTLSQVQTTANSASQKTATLETGLNGLSARFSSLRVGGHNYLRGTSDQYQTLTSNNYILGYTGNKNISFLDLLEPLKGETVTIRSYIKNDTDFPVRIQIWFTGGGINGNPVPAHEEGYSVATGKILENFASCNVAFVQVGDGTKNGGTIQHKEDKLEKGNIATDYSPNEADIESKVAEYKQTADQNYASLQSNLQTLDGTVKSNKATADQTAEGFKTRIESFETYKDGESTRAKSYFEASKSETAKQLTAERIAIAKDYVAKSTYTSDVTGIKNDLSTIKTTADTTKTNLANYQASNDKAVANLQSNLQTANGNISSLQTKVEAVPGQITSAVSAVEGKIPTTMGGRNYIQNYGLTVSGWSLNMSKWLFEIVADNTARSGQYLKATCTKAGTYGFFNRFVDLRGSEWQGKKMTYSIDIKASKSVQMTVGVEAFNGGAKKFNVTTAWQRFVSTDMVKFKNVYAFPFYIPDGGTWAVGDVVYLRDVQLEDGTIATAPKPAVEDTQSDITKLNTTLTQTANGLKQLSTQVTSQGSTITSHTNSINSLTTGLSAKVSQTDFNTLSGRVTTAENNIIAKANELSSKITSVEEKIPTSVGGRNLVRGTANFSSGWAWNTKVATITDIIDKFNVYHGTSTGTDTASNNYDVRFDNALTVLPDTEYTLSFWVKGSGTIYSHFFPSCVAYGINSDGKTTTAADGFITHTLKSNWERYWITWKTLPTANGLKNVLPCRQVSTAKSEVWLYGVKLEKGKIPTDWSPAPEDYDSKLITAQSEIKQTTDSIKASVSALDKSTVKSASLTINTDGIVMKAGKSTTDVANAIGSYFAVNQNAINLFSDKINIKGSMIVDGAITSTKIASKSINTAHLNGKIITADVISTGAITANAIKAGAVTTSAMSANSINGDRITAGTLDAAKIKAGSITASQIASGTITSSQIKTGGISSANIAAGAITTNHLATGSITADKIKAGSITSDMFRGNKITSLNNATTLDLQSGEITFNNIYATINQTKGSYKSQISLFSLDDKASTESSWSSTNVLAFNSTKLTSATRRTGSTVDMFPNFSLMTLYGEKIAFTGETSVSPGPNNAIIITTNSEGVDFINGLTNNSKGTWNYSMIMDFGTKAAISVPDIKLDGHFKSLTGILDDLCKKVGILWV